MAGQKFGLTTHHAPPKWGFGVLDRKTETHPRPRASKSRSPPRRRRAASGQRPGRPVQPAASRAGGDKCGQPGAHQPAARANHHKLGSKTRRELLLRWLMAFWLQTGRAVRIKNAINCCLITGCPPLLFIFYFQNSPCKGRGQGWSCNYRELRQCMFWWCGRRPRCGSRRSIRTRG
jgi:hypothetical protein